MQSLLDKLKREQLHARQTGRYPAASCPICLADFPEAEGSQESEAHASHVHEHGSGHATPSAPPLPGSSGGKQGRDGELQKALLDPSSR